MKALYRGYISVLQLLVIRGAGLLSLFFVNVVIARNFGPTVQGLFQIGLAIVIVVATVARLGQDQLMLRVAAEGKAVGDVKSTNNRLAASLTLGSIFLTLSTVVAIAAIYVGPIKNFGNQSQAFLAIMTLAILPTGILLIVTEATRGWQKINLSIAWQGSIPQSLFLILVITLIFAVNGNSLWIPVVYVFAFAISAIFACVAWMRVIGFRLQLPSWANLKYTFSQGTNFWLYSVVTSAVVWVDVFILSYLATPEAVGNYTAIVRTGAAFGTIVQIGSLGAVSHLALLYAQNEYDKFGQYFRQCFYFIAIGSIPFASTALVFSAQIMSIWGSNYADLSTQFFVYLVFQSLNLSINIFVIVMAIIGLERTLLALQLFHLAFKAIFTYLAFLSFGLPGAVWVSGISLTLFNIASAMALLRFLKSKNIKFL